MKRIIVIVLIITFSLSPFAAIPVKAQWVVLDPSNLVENIMQEVKEYGLDGIAWQIANMIIQRIAASTVKWINSGFKGSPAYLTNPQAYFANIGDQLSGQYIFGANSKLNSLCGPLQTKLKIALARNYAGEDNTQWQCTLTKAGQNLEDFMGDFSKGGWDSFFEVSQRDQMNPIGAYLQASNEIDQQILSKTNEKLNELNQGSGFLSYQTCAEYGTGSPGMSATTLPDGTVIPAVPATEPPCLVEKTVTPGSVINDQLNKVLGSGGQRLNAATEINQIVGALLSQLVNRVMGDVGGLLGSSATPSSGGSSYSEQLSKDSGTTDVLNQTPNTSIINEPIPNITPPAGSEPVWPPKGSAPACDPTTDPNCTTEVVQ